MAQYVKIIYILFSLPICHYRNNRWFKIEILYWRSVFFKPKLNKMLSRLSLRYVLFH